MRLIGHMIVPVYLSLVLFLTAHPFLEDHAPQPQDTLRQMLKVSWKKGPSLPQGFQDSGGGVVANTLISVGGFCGGAKDVPGKPDKYPRDFLKKVWGLDLSQPKASWGDLPEFPGTARQGLYCAAINHQRLYCWGGVNYSAPFTYKDGYRLSKQANHWVWEPLPELPSPVAFGSTCAIGSKIYVLGGCDYDYEKFYTQRDRVGNNPRLGARLLMIDTADLKSGWKRLPDCPGTPRAVAGMAAVNGKVFVIGGAAASDNASTSSFATVVDNWKYDPERNQWERIRDLPVSSGNFPSGQIVFNDRYIMLIGGAQYPKVENPDGTFRQSYGVPYKHYKGKPHFSNVWVYDVQRGLFGTATPLPLNNNMPLAVLNESKIYLIGGETRGAEIEGEHFGHHPDLCLIGEIEQIK